MPVRVYKCGACGEEQKALKNIPSHCGKPMEVTLSVPQAKFLEPRDPEGRRGKSVLKDQNRILKERAKDHTRDRELTDFVQEYGPLAAKVNGWVNDKGTVRKKIDEI